MPPLPVATESRVEIPSLHSFPSAAKRDTERGGEAKEREHRYGRSGSGQATYLRTEARTGWSPPDPWSTLAPLSSALPLLREGETAPPSHLAAPVPVRE